MTDLRLERGEWSVEVDDEGRVWIEGEGPENCAGPMPVDDFRWLVLTAGPAVVCALPREGDAGDGGGPSPAAADGTEPADEQLSLGGAADVAARARTAAEVVQCPHCSAEPGAPCVSPGGLIAKTHAARIAAATA